MSWGVMSEDVLQGTPLTGPATLLLAFLAGILTILSPCVLPLAPSSSPARGQTGELCDNILLSIIIDAEEADSIVFVVVREPEKDRALCMALPTPGRIDMHNYGLARFNGFLDCASLIGLKCKAPARQKQRPRLPQGEIGDKTSSAPLKSDVEHVPNWAPIGAAEPATVASHSGEGNPLRPAVRCRQAGDSQVQQRAVSVAPLGVQGIVAEPESTW